MSNLTLQLDDEALRQATSQAIMGILTPAMQNELISKAIQNILTETYGARRQNRIQEIFEQAMLVVAREEALKLVQTDAELRRKLDETLKLTANKLLEYDPNKVSDTMVESIIRAFRNSI